MSIAVSSLLGLGKGTLASIGEFLALFTFILELTALMIKVRTPSRAR